MPERSALRKQDEYSSGTSPSGHAGAFEAQQGWKAWWPLAFVVFALVALVLLPGVVHRRTEAIRMEITGIAEPARSLTNEIQLALAHEYSSVIGFQVTERAEFLELYRQTTAREAAALEALEPLARELGPDAARHLADLTEATAAWHGRVAAAGLLERDTAAVVRLQRMFEHHALYEGSAAAAAALSTAIQQSIERRREEIRAAGRVEFRLTIILVFLALAAALVVGWLGQRRRALAVRIARHAEDETLLREAASALAAARGLEEVLERIACSAVKTTRAFGSYVERVESRDGDVEVVAAGGAGTPPVGTHVPYPGSLTEEIIERGSPELLAEIGAIGERMAPYLVGSCRGCSGLVVPLLSDSDPLGALVLLRGPGQRPFQPDEAVRARTLGDLASIGLKRVLLLDSLRQSEQRARTVAENEREARGLAERRAREEAALRQATAAVTATYSVEEIIRQIARSALDATGADGAFVERIDIERQELEVVAVAGEKVPRVGERVAYPGSAAERVVDRARPVLIPDLSSHEGVKLSSLSRACVRCAALVVPLLDAGEAIGALVLIRGPGPVSFRPDEIERSHTFGSLAALAFRKVHLLEDSERKREELERVMQSRERLMRGFSHDVKNPLGAADGQLELLEEGIVDHHLTQRQKESVGRARSSIRRALGLIGDLLELARAEAGQIEIKHAPVDMREATREVAEEYRVQAEKAGLTFTIEIPTEIPVIDSDPDRARQILGNLLSNAVKYTEEGGITVRLAIREDGNAPGPGRWIAVDISDTGPGIPEERRHLLFREFSRIGPATAEGAGLGLAISRGLAHALSGDITLESNEGVGSTFTLWLPVSRPHESVADARERSR